ncbi:helix-turn-helix domain-containing protein [Lacticaseibacillus jixianensis]|uniref:Helix-turn-helix domain-containing protein n=1 Tax=Lacticaseibacillus jixianensis TaxID=2486012 RepID=A0ABW4BB08_9LACO|nr:helix-turn-helix domain-containing protein [Lacticaseibacillus jixianensis]
MTTFGENLKQRRKLRHITQAALAAQLNVSRSAVSNWEVGRNYPDLDMLVDLSSILQTPIDQLLKEAPAMVETVSREQRNSRKRKLVLWIIVPIFIILSLFTAYMLYLNVNAVNQTFFPTNSVILNVDQDQSNRWTGITWGKSPRIEGSLFKRTRVLTNDAGSDGQVELRVEDENGNEIGKSFALKRGHSHTFHLKSGNAFQVEGRLAPGQYFLRLE